MTYSPPFSYEPPLIENLSLPEDWETFLPYMTKITRETHKKVNDKDRGFYSDEEIINDQKWFDVANRQATHAIFRKVINCGALPNTAMTLTPHGIAGINNGWFFTRIYGTARDPVGLRFIPLPNMTPYPVSLLVDATNVEIATGANLSAFTQTYVVLEFWKI